MKLSLRLTFLTLFVNALGFTFATPQYTITDLGTLGGKSSNATAINNSGQVVGDSLTFGKPSFTRGFIFSPSTQSMQDIGTLGGSDESHSNGINIAGNVVGYSPVNGNNRAFLQFVINNNGILTDLGVLPGASESCATGISDSGAIVGFCGNEQMGNGRAFFCRITNGTPVMADLGTLIPGGTSYATAINASEEIVGYASNDIGNFRAFRYLTVNGFGTMFDLGVLPGGTYSRATAISNSGVAVGYGDTVNFQIRAFRNVFINGTSQMYELSPLPGRAFSEAHAINSEGTIVGSSNNGDFPTTRATRWIITNGVATVEDLNNLIPPNPGWVLRVAKGINDAGQIVGEGTLYLQTHSFLLTPIRPPSLPSISAPILLVKGKKNLTTTRSSFTIRGTAIGSVTKVFYKIGSRTKTATGTNIWKFKVPLKFGKNKIAIRAQGPGGTSASVKVTVIRK